MAGVGPITPPGGALLGSRGPKVGMPDFSGRPVWVEVSVGERNRNLFWRGVAKLACTVTGTGGVCH